MITTELMFEMVDTPEARRAQSTTPIHLDDFTDRRRAEQIKWFS